MVDCNAVWLALFKYIDEVWVPRKYDIDLCNRSLHGEALQ